MLNSAAPVSEMKVTVLMLMILWTGVEAAPTERGFVKPPHHLPSLTQAVVVPEKALALNPSQYLKHWLLNTKAAGLDGSTRITDRTTTGTIIAGTRAGRLSTNSGTAGPDKRAQMLKMISALEELHRTFNSTLSSRITILPRANGRNSGRKNKVLLAVEGGLKPTTVAPAAVNSTVSRASADVMVPSLTGRNFKKSLPPQTRKTNKRVCFWKYCSQN
uniref:urotensin II-related peptide n=1 Tax=Scatophagus argus TaxID=75038 RepID=UPI001ED8530F|nr:urotensin II-related peptide [Scatophagus argus]XP_046237886.1 urotensin II-related peptide [Scatophagus argus]